MLRIPGLGFAHWPASSTGSQPLDYPLRPSMDESTEALSRRLQSAWSSTHYSARASRVAISRVYAGIHYVPAVVQGITQGECIGRRVLDRLKTRDSER
jgi:hypothetical protein